VEEALQGLKTSKQGLSSEEAQKRHVEFGANYLDVSKNRSLWKLFFSQFLTLFVLILFSASAIKFFLNELLDAFVLLVTLVILIFIGFFQEMKAERAL